MREHTRFVNVERVKWRTKRFEFYHTYRESTKKNRSPYVQAYCFQRDLSFRFWNTAPDSLCAIPPVLPCQIRRFQIFQVFYIITQYLVRFSPALLSREMFVGAQQS